jgi:hypothetical protein
LLFNEIAKIYGFKLTRLTSENEIRKILEKLRPKQFMGDLIRVGPISDGGYVLPSTIEKVNYLISPGSNNQWDFEKGFFDKFGTPSIILDEISKKPADLLAPHTFIDTWVGSSNSPGVQTLSSVINQHLEEGEIFVLQMDIEGMEYESIIAFEDSHLKRAEILIIELHYLENLLNPEFVKYVFEPFLSKICQYHEIIFLNGNTYNDAISLGKLRWPRVIEITALKRDSRYKFGDPITDYNQISELISNEGSSFSNADMYWFNA